MQRLLTKYTTLLETKPLITKCCSAAVLMGMGDVISQRLEDAPKWDYFRTFRMSSVGIVLIGPCLHYWYRYLESVQIGGNKGVITKLAMDQLIFAPSIICAFFITAGIFEGKSVSEIRNEIQQSYFSALKMNYVFWPAANFVNFKFVPYHYRTVFANGVSIVWNAYLSNTKHKHIEDGIFLQERE